MRNEQLLRALSKHDDHANIDNEFILRRKKQIYADEIALTAYHEAWRNENLKPRQIDISFMQSLFLADNPHFKQIKAVFLRYNLQVSSTTPDQYDLRPRVIDAMVRYMHTILKCEDKQEQVKLLKKGYDWFMERLDSRLKYKPDINYVEQLQKIFQQSFASERLMLDKPNLKLPSEQMRLESRYYSWKARTMHKELAVPNERLKNYKTRIINFDNSKVVTEDNPTLTNYSSRVKYERPVFPIKSKTELPQDAPTQSLMQLNTAPTNQTQTAQQPIQSVNVEQVDDLQLGQPAEEEVQAEVEEEEGKLDPRLKNYLFPRPVDYRKALARLDYRERTKSNNQQRILKEDSANIAIMKQWARNKSRLKTEQSRRLAVYEEMAHKRGEANNQPSPIPSTTERLVLCGGENTTGKLLQPLSFEQKIDFERVELIRRQTHRTLHSQKKEYKINTARGLSMWDKGRLKTEGSASTGRPFSKILSDYSKARINQQAIDEVAQIKTRFAKLRVGVEMTKLAEGLFLPEGADSQTTEQVTAPPMHLLSNPYFKVGKKKKKKGKKKK